MTTNSRDARNQRKGYLEALGDIATKLEDEGLDGVLDWLKNNYYDTLPRAEVRKRTAKLSSLPNTSRARLQEDLESVTEDFKAVTEDFKVAFPKLDTWVEEKALARKEEPKKAPKIPLPGVEDDTFAEWTAFCQALPKGSVLPSYRTWLKEDLLKDRLKRSS